jgi:hypothetical protein
MTAGVPRKRTFAAMLLAAAAAGGALGLVDRAHGVAPSADKIFSDTPAASCSSRSAGEPCRHPCNPRAGVAAHQEARS